MPAQILGFNTLPSEGFICYDSSFLIRIFGNINSPNKPPLSSKLKNQIRFDKILRQKCKEYADKLRKSDICTYVCDCVVQECLFLIIKWKLMEDSDKQYRDINKWENLYKKNPKIIGSYAPLIEDFYSFTNAIGLIPLDYVPLKNEVLTTYARNIIESCSVLPMDAYIVEHARKYGINTFATCDTDWTRIDNITIHIPHPLIPKTS